MKKTTIFAVLAMLVLSAFFVGPAIAVEPEDPGPPSDNGVQPIWTEDNPTCSALAPPGVTWYELKVEPVNDGTYSDGFLTVTVDEYTTSDGQAFNWTSNIGVVSVFVKGGQNGNFYLYDPPPEVKADNYLHAPINPSNNLFYGLSHVSFCYDLVPSIDVKKTGDPLSKVGDTVTYDFTITNDGDIPLTLDSVNDTLLGDLTAVASAAGCGTLAPEEDCTFSVDREVQAGDDDPLSNTVTVTYSGTLPDKQQTVNNEPKGEGASVTDPVDYTITLSNNSSDDTPDMYCTAVDTLLGTVFDGVLPLGDTVLNLQRTVQPGDPDPLGNEVTLTCSPDGFPNVLFQPSITFDKTGDTLSKVGDDVSYTITLNNTSSADTPNLECTITDEMLGIDKSVTLASGASDVTNATYTVQAGDPDPLENMASVSCSPVGFPNVLEASDDHEVELFQPDVDVTKSCDDYSKAGDDLHCTITVANMSSGDSPDLVNGSIVDDLLGDLLDPANPYVTGSDCSATLPTGTNCTIETSYTVQPTDDDFTNTVTVHYNPEEFPNDITDSDSETVDIVHPGFNVTKSCVSDEPVPVGASANFEIVIWNTGDIPLVLAIFDPVLDIDDTNVDLAVWVDDGDGIPENGEPGVIVIEAGVVVTGGEDITNEVWVTATLPAMYDLPNEIEKYAGDTCEVEAGATRTPGFWKTHDVYTTHVFEYHLGGTIDLGWKTLGSSADVFGMFWANKAKNSDGTRQTCQAQVLGSFHLLAAILNEGLDNGAAVPDDPVTGDDLITAMRNALTIGNRKEILRLIPLLDAYNNSGDGVAIIDLGGTLVGRADPKAAKGAANISIADCNSQQRGKGKRR